jgi:sortase (surface protein transpeptidase)
MSVLKDAKVGDKIVVTDGYNNSWVEEILEIRKIYKTDRFSIYKEDGKPENILSQHDHHVIKVKGEE